MAIAEVQLPDGRIAEIEVPEGATEEQILRFAAANLSQLTQQQTQQQPGLFTGALGRKAGEAVSTVGLVSPKAKDVGEELLAENQAQYQRFKDIQGKGIGGFGLETAGEIAGDIATQATVGAVGSAIGTAAAPFTFGIVNPVTANIAARAIYNFGNSFREIRETQAREGIDDLSDAIFGAAASAGLETIGPVSRVAGKIGRAVLRKGRKEVIDQLERDAPSALKEFGFKVGKGVAGEAATEIAQESIEGAAGKGKLTPGQVAEELTEEGPYFAGLKGGLGGGIVSGGEAAVGLRKRQQVDEEITRRETAKIKKERELAAKKEAEETLPEETPAETERRLRESAQFESRAQLDKERLQLERERLDFEKARFEREAKEAVERENRLTAERQAAEAAQEFPTEAQRLIRAEQEVAEIAKEKADRAAAEEGLRQTEAKARQTRLAKGVAKAAKRREALGDFEPEAPVTTQQEADIDRLEDLQKIDFQHDLDKRKVLPNPTWRNKVHAEAERITKNWKIHPNIVVFDNFDNPNQVRLAIRQEANRRNIVNPAAFRHGNTIYINSGAINSKADLIKQIQHEGVGHIGTELYQGSHLNEALDYVAKHRKDEIGLLAVRHRYKINDPDPEVRAAETRKAAGEVLARLAETNPRHHLVKQFLAWVRRGLRKLGLTQFQRISDNELIVKYVLPAQKFMEKTGVRREGKPLQGKISSMREEIDFSAKAKETNKKLFARRREIQQKLRDPHLTNEQITALDKEQAQIDRDIYDNTIRHLRKMTKEKKPLTEYEPDFQHEPIRDYSKTDTNTLLRLKNNIRRMAASEFEDQAQIDNWKEDVRKIDRVLSDRGVDLNQMPKFPDIDDTGEALPGDMTLEEAEADRLRREAKDEEVDRRIQALEDAIRTKRLRDALETVEKTPEPAAPAQTPAPEKGFKDMSTENLFRARADIERRLENLDFTESTNDEEINSLFEDLGTIDRELDNRPDAALIQTGQTAPSREVTEQPRLEDREAANTPPAPEGLDFQHGTEQYEEKTPHPFMRPYDWVVDNIRSAADLLKKGTGRIKQLGQAITNLVDNAQINRGRTQEFMVPVLNQIDDAPNKKEIITQFGDWMKAVNTGDQKAQAVAEATSDPLTQDLIKAVRNSLDAIGAKMESLGMMATDQKGNKVPFKMRKDFLPAILLPKYRSAITNPYGTSFFNNLFSKTDKYSPDFQEIADHMIATKFMDGKTQVKTHEDAHKFFRRILNEGGFESGFWGDMGMSKSLPFPLEAYDHSLDAVRKYMDRAAERLAQEESFTVEVDGKKEDLFDLVLSELDKGDPRYSYISSLKSLVYNDRFGKAGWEKTAQTLSTLATGLQISGPKSVFTNFIGGLTNIMGLMDIGAGIKGFRDLMDFEGVASAAEIANNLGIISDDMLRLMADWEAFGLFRYSGFNKIAKFSSDLTAQLMGLKRLGPLSLGGLKRLSFNSSENAVRIITLMAAKHQLREWIQHYQSSGMDARSRVFEKFCEEEGIDMQALMKEEGWTNIKESPQTARFLRRMVNRTQGSYRLDQVPKFLDTWYGRFFFKYNKYGFQLGRMFDKQVIGYMRDPDTRAEGVKNLFKYFSIYAGMSYLTAEIIKSVFGDDKLPDEEEFLKVLNEKAKNEKEFDAILYTLQNIGNSLHVLGAMGPISIGWQQYDQFMEYGSSPLSAPGLAVVANLTKMLSKWLWSPVQAAQNPEQTLSDAGKFMLNNVSLLSQASQALGNLAGKPQILKNRRLQAKSRAAIDRFYRSQDQVEREAVGLQDILDTVFKGKGVKNKFLTDRINKALMTGDTLTAKNLFDEIVNPKDRTITQQEQMEYINAVKSSVMGRRPFGVHGKPGGVTGTALFMQWAQKNMPREEYEEIKMLDDLYMITAVDAGLVNKDKVRPQTYAKAIREFEKSQRPAKPFRRE